MLNKVLVLIVVVLVAALVFLGLKVNGLQQQLDELKKTDNAQIVITPENPSAKDVSPFEQKNNDPALQLPADSKPVSASTTIKFEKLSHDFGRIQQGAKASVEFAFINTGTNPLIISNARGSCGCTVPTWPHQPIPPGASGKIFVVFDSYGKSGEQTKTVTVVANTAPSSSTLTIQATIIPQDR
jgi:hypothetical protein